MGPRELRFKAFSSAYDFFGAQYPHQSSNGRRELRAMENDAASSPRPINGASSSRDRSRSKVNSVDTAIHIPSTGTPSDGFDYQNEDFQKRYSARRTATQSEGGLQRQNSKSPHGEHIPMSPDFTDMDDGTGQPAAPADFSKRGIHIPTRTRYVSRFVSPTRKPIDPLPPALILTASQQQQRQAKACAAAIPSPTFQVPCRSRHPELLAAFARDDR